MNFSISNSKTIIGASLSEPHSSEYYTEFPISCVRPCRVASFYLWRSLHEPYNDHCHYTCRVPHSLRLCIRCLQHSWTWSRADPDPCTINRIKRFKTGYRLGWPGFLEPARECGVEARALEHKQRGWFGNEGTGQRSWTRARAAEIPVQNLQIEAGQTVITRQRTSSKRIMSAGRREVSHNQSIRMGQPGNFKQKIELVN